MSGYAFEFNITEPQYGNKTVPLSDIAENPQGFYNVRWGRQLCLTFLLRPADMGSIAWRYGLDDDFFDAGVSFTRLRSDRSLAYLNTQVFLMIPGVSMFYSGVVRREMSVTMAWLPLMTGAVVGVEV